MTEQQFEQRFQQIEQETARLEEQAVAYKDQALAILFLESDWTQEKLAKRMGKSQKWIDFHLRLGRFLKWLSTSGTKSEKPPESLTERRFRSCWAKTRGSRRRKGKAAEAEEYARFTQVLTMLSDNAPPGWKRLCDKPGTRDAIKAECGDGQWYTVAEILASVESLVEGVDTKQVSDSLRGMETRPTKDHTVESRKKGRTRQYRITPTTGDGPRPDQRIISIYEEIKPLIEEIDEWGHMHEFRQSPVALRVIAEKLRRIFDAALLKSHA